MMNNKTSYLQEDASIVLVVVIADKFADDMKLKR